jgi:HAD superfamily hydrolase (TIGR01490 family)
MKEVAAFFDVEGTIYTDNTWKALIRYHWKRNRRRGRALAYLAFHLAKWILLHKTGLRQREPATREWAVHMPWLVAGWSVEETEDIFDWMLDRYLIPSVHPEAAEAIRSHRSQGHHVILVSGAPQDLLQMLAERLGASGALGTGWEKVDGRYTGKVVPPVCMGEDKVVRIRELLANDLSEVDMSASYAYGDTLADVPLLSLVGHPVATFPDAELASLARERGWEVLGTPV